MRIKPLLTILFFSAAIVASASYAKTNAESLDQIIAVVNDDVITNSELKQGLSVVKMQIAQEHVAMPAETILQKQVLDQLINKKIQLQLAKQAGVTATEADLDGALKRIATQNQMSVAELYSRISKEGMSVSHYRNEMRDQLTMQKLQQQEVVSHITISADEVTSFLNSKTWQNNSSKEYHLEDILISTSDTPSSEELGKAQKHAADLVAKIKAGASFRSVAQAESGDNRALKGGDLGWRSLPEIPTAFADHIIRMQTNDVSEPIQTPNGFHILHLVAARNIASANDQAKPNRKQVEELLLQRKFEEAVQNWVSKLRSQAFIQNDLVKA